MGLNHCTTFLTIQTELAFRSRCCMCLTSSSHSRLSPAKPIVSLPTKPRTRRAATTQQSISWCVQPTPRIHAPCRISASSLLDVHRYLAAMVTNNRSLLRLPPDPDCRPGSPNVHVLRCIALHTDVLPVTRLAASLTYAQFTSFRRPTLHDRATVDTNFGIFWPVEDAPKSPARTAA